MWSVIQVALTLFPPCSITNIFRNWLIGMDNRFKKHIRVGAMAFIWSLWLCRINKVFNDKNSSILQVIYGAIGTLCLWSALQRPQDRDLYTEICARLEATARYLFTQYGWSHSLRIGASS
jgi:formate-dependent nitrite reductase membrane component NrfD